MKTNGKELEPVEPQLGEGLQAALGKAEVELSDEEKRPCPYCGKLLKHVESHIQRWHQAEAEQTQKQSEHLAHVIKAIQRKLGLASVDLVRNLTSLAARRDCEFPSADFRDQTAELHALIVEYLLERWGAGGNHEIILIGITALVQWNEFFTYNWQRHHPGADRQREDAIGPPPYTEPAQGADSRYV